jgi:hypothetical protein
LSVFTYFRHPFPSTEGFSAYRMPGMAVHGPLILASTLAGFFLCWPHGILRPLLAVWVPLPGPRHCHPVPLQSPADAAVLGSFRLCAVQARSYCEFRTLPQHNGRSAFRWAWSCSLWHRRSNDAGEGFSKIEDSQRCCSLGKKITFSPT